MLASCATAQEKSAANTLWAVDTEAVYPARDYLIAVERGGSQKDAEAAAINALARIFRTDVAGVTNAYNEYTQRLSKDKGGKQSVYSDETREFAQNVRTEAGVDGLIGLVTESARGTEDGKAVWWANARIDRKKVGAIYEKQVRENEKLIASERESAARAYGKFDAYGALHFAYSTALVTDDIQAKLAVLDDGAARRGVSYGNADAVKSLLNDAARNIVIDVRVTGDASGRIARALSEFFALKGFRTGAGGEYRLEGRWSEERVDIPSKEGYIYYRFLLDLEIKDKAGAGVFSYQANAREGHINEAEVKQRLLRSAEAAISSGKFAEVFDEFLAD